LGRLFLFINLAVFAAVLLDKLLSRRGSGWVPESSLLLVGALGGAPGLWAGMLLFRHKLERKRFVLGAAASALTTVALLVLMRRGV
jgi:uncharacterized membrane protein YsdA (DUF1294 family)